MNTFLKQSCYELDLVSLFTKHVSICVNYYFFVQYLSCITHILLCFLEGYTFSYYLSIN